MRPRRDEPQRSESGVARERDEAGPSIHRVDRPVGAEAYSVEMEFLAPPPLPGEVAALPTLDRAIDAVAADLLLQALNCVRAFGDFHLALSGDEALEPLYARLMYDPNLRGLPWRRTHLWVVSERCVGFESPESAFRRIRETIVDHSDIPPEQVHPMFPHGETPAESYEHHLREVLGWREKGQDRLDHVLLRLDAEGGMAGLAPGSRLLSATDRLIGAEGLPRPEGRVTMLLPLINAARFIAVYACGPESAAPLGRLVGGREAVDDAPARGLRPVGGQLKWYVDREALG